MGTSKGYLAPTSEKWKRAKLAVTNYAKVRDANSKAAAAGKYASALKDNVAGGVTFFNAATSFIGFIQRVSSDGLNNALQEINREDLIGKSSEEIWNELIWEFTNSGSTTEDSLAADALSAVAKNLNLEDISEIRSLSPAELLINLLIEYIKSAFDFTFYERISTGRSPEEVDDIIQVMNAYLENELNNELILSSIKDVDFTNMSASQVVKNALDEALHIYERYYEEE